MGKGREDGKWIRQLRESFLGNQYTIHFMKTQEDFQNLTLIKFSNAGLLLEREHLTFFKTEIPYPRSPRVAACLFSLP